ncbi:hypothetical protein NQZ68_028956 [Dissostichus eleginoides]|nr:hypothetical protein NQZ68_028956 [Dissostichus eleginoides]
MPSCPQILMLPPLNITARMMSPGWKLVFQAEPKPPPHALSRTQELPAAGERMETHSQILDRLRSAFRSGITVPEAFRQAQLKQLMSLMTENEDQILDALKKDLAKPKFESIIAEVDMVINELHFTIANLNSWMQPEYVSKNLATKLDDCFVRREPLGVVLIIGPWNYPLQLLLSPLIAAIGAVFYVADFLRNTAHNN